MDENDVISTRLEKLKEIKLVLSKTDDKLTVLAEELNWDYKKLIEDTSTMVTCSINPQHRMPVSSLKAHEQNCSLHNEGYSNSEKTFPEYSGTGSCIILTPESIHSITKNISSYKGENFNVPLPGVSYYYDGFQNNLSDYDLAQSKPLRAVPQSSTNLDQNFEREEKLAIYDYVIANTEKQESHSDLYLQPSEKSEEKREMAAWEIAAAERDAKRRRASYRNKVHTNRKTHTEILKEVIEAQMEAFKGDVQNEKTEEFSRFQTVNKKSSHESREDKRRHHESSSRHDREDRNKSRNHDNHSKHREHKRSPSDTGSDTKSRSRFHDKHRKWKTYEGRSHSHRSSHTHRR